ncbi:MAG: hypothetical protein PHR45_05315 [Muribaculaceae bacterium]|nr:hypothetical protein [Muribaculaceae bacterium]
MRIITSVFTCLILLFCASVGYSQESSATTILEQDFSMFTDGSEATPAKVDISSYSSGKLSATLTGWTGRKVYEAGGTLYIGAGSSSYLTTPKLNTSANSGIFKIILEVRAEADYGNAITCQVGYSTAETMIVSDDKWHTVEFISEKGSSSTALKISSMFNGFYIRKITVLSSDKFLKAPQASFPTDFDGKSFTAKWTRCATATGYIISVYTKDEQGNKNIIVSEEVASSVLSKKIEIAEPKDKMFFSVRAKNANTESKESDEWEIKEVITAIDAPTALEATNITATGFTANWSAVDKASSYILNIYKHEVLKENRTVTVLSENFEGITKGTKTNVDYPATLSEMLDKYTKVPGWSAYQHCYVAGHVGFAPFGSTATLTSPEIDLSANNGAFSVTFDLDALINDQEVLVELLNQNEVVLEAKTLTATTSIVNVSASFTKGVNTSYIRITYKGSSKIFVTNFNITQDLKAGDTVRTIHSMSEDITETSRNITDIALTDDIYFTYTVQAVAISANSDGEEIKLTSNPSNTIEVKKTVGVESNTTTKDLIFANGDDINVMLSADGIISIYNANGSLIQRVNGQAGMNVIKNNDKFIIVVTANNTAKILK